MRPIVERALVFDCQGSRLLGILHVPAKASRGLGVVIVVGGPQYRVGSHRQFVLMARAMAEAGYPVLRFDHRGIGDSDGPEQGFENLDADVRSAIDTLYGEIPGLNGCVVFGLCDAASAALMYCVRDPRLRGLIVANPWVRSEEGQARAYVRHYYGKRLFQKSFWSKVISGRFDAAGSLGDLLRKLRTMASRPSGARAGGTFQERMLDGLSRFRGQVLVLVSGLDLTAAEFTDLCASDPRWGSALGRRGIEIRRYERADHTFAEGLETAISDCTAWLDALPGR